MNKFLTIDNPHFKTPLVNEYINNNPDISEYFSDISQSIAERAFTNTSFIPERRGERVRIDYVESLLTDKSKVLDEICSSAKRGAVIKQDYDVIVNDWFQSHRKRLHDHYLAWLYAHGRVASSFIVGPAKFPVERNQKLSNYADAKLSAISEFRNKSIKNILKCVMPYGDGFVIQIDDPNACDKIENKIAQLEKQREDMKVINKLIRKYFKNGNPENLVEFKNIMKTEFSMDENEIAYLMKPNCRGDIIGFRRFELQNLGANINRYKKRMTEVKVTNSVSINHEFSNGIKVTISDDQKICIHFGFKPSEEMRSLLKSNAFKFSRSRDNAWIRKLTLNARASYFNVIKPKLEELSIS